MKGAKYYMDNSNYALAAFSMHQAVENTLIAVIKVLSSYRFTAHHLLRMIRITLLFTEELKDVLELDTAEGAQLFSLLQAAYADARL